MFNPKDYVMDMRGKDYLEVKWRIVWFRDVHPSGSIETELVNTEPIVFKATVKDVEGRTLGTGHGTPKMHGVAKSRPFEGAETAAIGRALAAAGYGTQFTGEEEGEHLADAPVEQTLASANGKAKKADTLTPNTGADRPYSAEVIREKLIVSAKAHTAARCGPSDAQEKMVAPNIQDLFRGQALAEDKRRAITEYVFGATSTKDLTPGEKLALLRWCNYQKADSGEWTPDYLAIHEGEAIYTAYMKAAGQTELLEA